MSVRAHEESGISGSLPIVCLARHGETAWSLEPPSARLQDEGAKSYLASWNERMAAIGSKGAALERGEGGSPQMKTAVKVRTRATKRFASALDDASGLLGGFRLREGPRK